MAKYFLLCNNFIEQNYSNNCLTGGHGNLLAVPCKDEKQAIQRGKTLINNKDIKVIYVGIKIGPKEYAVNPKKGILKADTYIKQLLAGHKKLNKIVVKERG